MEITLNWKGKLSFDGAGNSGFVQHLDTSASSGGEDSGARPMELIALGMAGCTAMDVISILQKKQQDVKGFRVLVHADQSDEHPRVFTRATIEYLVTGNNVDEAAVRRAVELSVERYCPAYAMLSKAFPIALVYTIFDEEGKMLKQGEYQKQ